MDFTPGMVLSFPKMQKSNWICLLWIMGFLLVPASDSFASNDTTQIKKYLRVAETYKINNPDTALKLVNQAYQSALPMGNALILSSIYNSFAGIYYYSGNLQLAIDYYFKAMRQLEENTENKGSPEFIRASARIYCNIGNCYFDLNLEEMALTQYKKSLTIIEESDSRKQGIFSPGNKMLLLYNIANIYANRNNFSKAKEYYLMVQEINKSVNDNQVKAGLLESLGVIYLKEGNSPAALDSYLKALEIRTGIDDKRGIAGTFIFLGDYYRKLPDNVKAMDYYQKSMALGKQSARWQLVQEAANNMTKIYLDRADYKNAFLMNKYSTQLNDSIFNSKSATHLTRMALQFEYDRQIKNQELRQQQEIDAQKTRKTFFIFLSVILIFLIGMIILMLLNLNKKLLNARLRQKQLDLESRNIRLEREKLEAELTLKNKELTTNVMYLVQKNEFITDITKRAKELIAHPPEQAKKAFASLVSDLQRNTDDKVWKEFEIRFQNVHQEFYQRLNERFPDLTPNEKKLAAFLRLNMSTKDISAITFQSPDSIRIARSRLRRKFDLPSDDNLIAFLESI